MRTEEVVANYRKIKPEYAFNPDIMSNEEERVARVKEIIETKLSTADQTILILYVDLQSYRKVAKHFGVSHMSIRREVQRIKKIILEEYGKDIHH